MASLKAIRKRITSTKATQKITKAMKMVAGARLARAQQRITALRPYAVKTGEVLATVAATVNAAAADGAVHDLHPLLAKRPEKRIVFLVVTSDRGLCGALNTNINKLAFRTWREKVDEGAANVTFLTAGRKGREFIQRRGGEVLHDFVGIYDGLDVAKAREIAGWLVKRFTREEIDAIYVVYSEFKSAITQKATIERLLPLAEPPPPPEGAAQAPQTQILYEPNEKALLERLMPMYIEITLYRALLETQASFFGAQMTAMDAATRNAKDMIGKLTLQYNRARQAAITKELMEIIGGAEALKE
jgi:F-type H+-transporting ATPase subunit gamma